MYLGKGSPHNKSSLSSPFKDPQLLGDSGQPSIPDTLPPKGQHHCAVFIGSETTQSSLSKPQPPSFVQTCSAQAQTENQPCHSSPLNVKNILKAQPRRALDLFLGNRRCCPNVEKFGVGSRDVGLEPKGASASCGGYFEVGLRSVSTKVFRFDRSSSALRRVFKSKNHSTPQFCKS